MSPQVNIRIRKTKTTVLIVGEGQKDKAFIQSLQEMYISREDNIAVKVECGSGGSPRCVIEKTIRLRDNKAYDKCVVLLDADRRLETDRELKRRMKEKPPVEIIWVKPCMEGLLLEILRHPNFSRHKASVDSCKHAFALYLPIDKQTEKYSYARIFSRATLDSHRRSIRELDTIFKAMQV